MGRGEDAAETLVVAEHMGAMRREATQGRGAALSMLRARMFPALQRVRYRLMNRLGAGGMGVVFRAYDVELAREVAIKILRPDGRTGPLHRMERALRREARAIANVRHPNVIEVFDVGAFGPGFGPLADEPGYPSGLFIVMELVEGESLRQWLERSPRSHTAIVDMTLQAARGLAAAHRAGLLHRDFKPCNAVVGFDGRCRVLDFGLARPCVAATSHPGSLGRSVPDNTREDTTATGATVVGTPAYMAPELVVGGEASPASDQFALCVSLYEAVYGRRPFAGETAQETMDAILRGQLQPPTSGAPVDRRLRAIILRGLHRDPDRRHPSVDALIDALKAWRRRRRPSSARHVLAASTLGLGIAGLVLGLLPSTTAPVHGPRRATSIAAQVAPADLDEVEQIERLLDLGDSAAAVTTARTLLEEALQSGARRRSLQAEVLLGRGLALERHPDLARHHLEGAFLAARSLGYDAVACDAALAVLPEIIGAGEEAEARRWIAHAEVAARRAAGTREDAAARLRYYEGLLAMHLGDYDNARRWFGAVQSPGVARRDATLMLDAELRLSGTERRAGHNAQAWRHLDRAETLAAALPVRHRLRATLQHARAMLLIQEHQPERAATLMQTELDRQVGERGREHPITIETEILLAEAERATHQPARSEAHYRHAYESLRARMGPDRVEVARIAQMLGELGRARGAFDEAEMFLREALAGFRAAAGDRHPQVGLVAFHLAALEASTGRCAPAMVHFGQALEAIERAGGSPLHRVSILHNRARFRRECDVEGADQDLEQALEILRGTVGDEATLLEQAPPAMLENYGELLLDLGRPADAVFEAAVRQRVDQGHEGGLAGARWGLARALVGTDPGRARSLAKQALAVLEDQDPPRADAIEYWLDTNEAASR